MEEGSEDQNKTYGSLAITFDDHLGSWRGDLYTFKVNKSILLD